MCSCVHYFFLVTRQVQIRSTGGSKMTNSIFKKYSNNGHGDEKQNSILKVIGYYQKCISVKKFQVDRMSGS